MQEGMSLCSLEASTLSLASGWGSGGKTEVNLKAVTYDKHIALHGRGKLTGYSR